MSSGIDKITNHPSFACKDEVMQICQPLEQLACIDYFSHIRIDQNSHFSALGRNPAFVQHYFENQYYNSDVHMIAKGSDEQYIIHDNIEMQGHSKKLHDECDHFGLNHIFSILMRDGDTINGYHFATSQKQSGFNELYLRHLPLLKKFISHFNCHVQTDRNLSDAYNWRYKIKKLEASYPTKYAHLDDHMNTEFARNLERYYLPSNSKLYLTQREIAVLRLMHEGLSAPDISLVLEITERTVREHILNVKAKLNCKTLFQLGEVASKILESYEI